MTSYKLGHEVQILCIVHNIFKNLGGWVVPVKPWQTCKFASSAFLKKEKKKKKKKMLKKKRCKSRNLSSMATLRSSLSSILFGVGAHLSPAAGNAHSGPTAFSFS